jgi:hypothetical protein
MSLDIASTVAQRVPHDKALHLIAGALLALVGLLAAHLHAPYAWPPVVVAGGLCIAGAVARELHNRLRGGPFDLADIAWTLVGGSVVLIAAWAGA